MEYSINFQEADLLQANFKCQPELSSPLVTRAITKNLQVIHSKEPIPPPFHLVSLSFSSPLFFVFPTAQVTITPTLFFFHVYHKEIEYVALF